MKHKHRWLRWVVLGVLACAVVFIIFVWWWLPGTHAVDHDIVLPTRYVAGLFYAEPVTSSGQRLSLLADTGGGLFVTHACAERCGMHPITVLGTSRARLPPFRHNTWIPEPTGGERWIAVTDGEGDGMLGQRWFAGGVWTFDYPAKKLVLRRTPFTPTDEMRRHSVPLGFRDEWKSTTKTGSGRGWALPGCGRRGGDITRPRRGDRFANARRRRRRCEPPLPRCVRWVEAWRRSAESPSYRGRRSMRSWAANLRRLPTLDRAEAEAEPQMHWRSTSGKIVQ
jgi:hypothetical protein